MSFEGDANDEDAVNQSRVDAVRDAIEAMLIRGVRKRRGIFR